MTNTAKRKPPLSILLPPELEAFLRKRAQQGYRSISKEIAMRLEQSRQAELEQQGPAE